MLYGRLTAPLTNRADDVIAPAGAFVVLDDRVRMHLLRLGASVELTDHLPPGADLVDLAMPAEGVTDRMLRGGHHA